MIINYGLWHGSVSIGAKSNKLVFTYVYPCAFTGHGYGICSGNTSNVYAYNSGSNNTQIEIHGRCVNTDNTGSITYVNWIAIGY